jgi:hypothetical protein
MTKQWLAVMVLMAGAALAQQHQGGERRGPPHGGPPQEALAACQGLSEGASCSFTHNERALTGTCHNGPRGEQVACVPAGMRPPTQRQ